MTSSIRNTTPTPLETEYKRLVKQTAKNNNSSENIRAGMSPGRQEDVVTLSSGIIDAVKPPTKLKPSQPVTRSEMQSLQSQFSIYG
jgi:hypothetical protein